MTASPARRGWYTDPDSYLDVHYAYLDDLPVASRQRLVEAGLLAAPPVT